MENTENTENQVNSVIQVTKEMDMCYSYATHKFVAYNPWQEIQESLLRTKLESPFWKINPDICGIPPIYYYEFRDPEELMIYKPSETEVGKGEYYWLRNWLHKWILERGRYTYAFGDITRGFFRYEERVEVGSVEEGLALLLEKTTGGAHEVAAEAVVRIELFKKNQPDLPFYDEDYGDDFDYYYRRGLEEEPVYKPKKMFPWTKHTSRYEEKKRKEREEKEWYKR